MMTATPWPEWIEATLWAKSPEGGGSGRGESLARHTWYVLEKLSEAIRTWPNLPTTLGVPNLWNRLYWACFLHDFGKAATGFQDRLRGGPKWPHRHEVLSLVFLDWMIHALSQEDLNWVSAAIASHHKDAGEIQSMYMDTVDPDDDPLIGLVRDIRPEAMAGLWRWIAECTAGWIRELNLESAGIDVPILDPLPSAVRCAQDGGADRARHWLRANRMWLRDLNQSGERSLVIGTLALRGRLILADRTASAHVTSSTYLIGTAVSLLSRLEIKDSDLFAHQRACMNVQGSAVLVAPTGSGKTESALLWACSQTVGHSSAPRLLYTLPYQASMNAMYYRLNRRAFPDQVGLEHSRSVLALYRQRLSQDYSPKEAARSARWSRDLARLNCFPVRVLSPYQILKAPYRIEGYEALLCDLFDSAMILDEVHAYDPSRLSLILSTVRYLRQEFGARFFVMSATLPALLQTRLKEALGDCTLIRATPDLFARFQRHRLHLIDDDLLGGSWASTIAKTAENGQSVLVCCNTVGRAQEMCDAIQRNIKDSVEVILLHGRFNGRDRLQRESAVQAAAGAGSGTGRTIILVATQVVEVSLDIDLDTIFSDPAPLEALIQRFGRVNRRRRKQHAPVHVFMRPSDGQGIYSGDLVKQGLKVLDRNDEQMIDESQISNWLDEVYKGEIGEKWNKEYDRSRADFESACLGTLRAFDSDSDLEQAFYQAFDSIEVLPDCLEDEYRELMEQDAPLEASQLPVPISWQQFWKLRRDGRVHEHSLPHWPRVVDAAYSPRGLEI